MYFSRFAGIHDQNTVIKGHRLESMSNRNELDEQSVCIVDTESASESYRDI